jgi:hypothetical protein
MLKNLIWYSILVGILPICFLTACSLFFKGLSFLQSNQKEKIHFDLLQGQKNIFSLASSNQEMISIFLILIGAGMLLAGAYRFLFFKIQ